MAKGDKHEFTVNGNKYVIQHPGVGWVVEHTDKCTNISGNLVKKDYINGLLEHVIIEPKNLTLDSFDTAQEMSQVVRKIESFL
jgi:hypothetical protein